MDVLILAGGFGTRLRSVVNDLPKPLADIRGTPFLIRLLRRLECYDVNKVYISLHYRSDLVKQEIEKCNFAFEIITVVDVEPLGTGGAIKNALNFTCANELLVINGDTYSSLDLEIFYNSARALIADVVIAGVTVDDKSRFGAIEVQPETRRVLRFAEKGGVGCGVINGGIYYLRTESLLTITETIFSFEERVLACEHFNVFCIENKCDFIDIGVPEDYRRACSEAF